MVYDSLVLEKGVDIEDLPINIDPYQIRWQTKTIATHPSMNKYKISKDGKLLREEFTKRKMTQEEMNEKAKDRGYDTWEAWEADDSEIGPLDSWKYIKDDVWWSNQNMHGEFKFYASTRTIEEVDDYFIKYKATYTKGELDEIVLDKFKTYCNV